MTDSSRQYTRLIDQTANLARKFWDARREQDGLFRNEMDPATAARIAALTNEMQNLASRLSFNLLDLMDHQAAVFATGGPEYVRRQQRQAAEFFIWQTMGR
jgi:hypothetical protein